MTTTLISGDDIRYLVQQDTSALTTTMGQMTTLLQGITDLQNDSDSRVEAMEKQGWFKRMWNTITGKNKATVKELQKNQDKVVTYVSEAVSNLYNMNCIDQQVICSLGNRMNQIYAQVTDAYQEQLQMKAQIAELQQIQQQTLQALGNFVTTLNEKIESVDNFHMLTTEIQQGRYNDPSSLYSLCCVLAQLDKRTLEDERKCSILREALVQSQIVHEDGITVRQYMEEILALPENKVGVVYLELCNFRESFPANLFAEMIENYHFLSKMEKMSKKKDVLVQRILEQYELDDSAEFSSLDVFESFLENKQSTLVSPEMLHIEEKQENADFDDANTEDTDEEIDYDILSEAELIDLANGGDVKAMEMLAFEYLKNVEKDDANLDKVAEWFKKAADKGSTLCMAKYGEYCYYGFGVLPNNEEAVRYLKMALEREEIPMAQYLLGKCYSNGEGVPESTEKAEELFLKAAKGENPFAASALGCLYRFSYKNIPQAIQWYKKAGDYRDIAEIYRYGENIEQDRTKAYEYFKKAAEQGDEISQYDVGRCYEYGDGVEKNEFEAVKWYRKAAEQGYIEAQYALGLCYDYGMEVEDRTEAVKWYRKAAEQGNAEAQFSLGQCYFYGNGVNKNKFEAVEWYQKAAEQGEAHAQFYLGFCYDSGDGIKEDKVEAAKWYQKAAEQGIAKAQYNLALHYYYGVGVSENKKNAKYWLECAADQGDESAQKFLYKNF